MLRDLFGGGGDESGGDCACEPAFDGETLVVAAGACPGAGDLAAEPACRATVVDALRARDAEAVVVRSRGLERRYAARAVALLVAAGRFSERIRGRDPRLSALAARDPLAAARDAGGRAGPIAEVAAETALLEVAAAADGAADALRAFVGPTLARTRIDRRPPPEGRLVDTRRLSTGATVRHYETDRGTRYHLEPLEHRLDAAAYPILADAYARLAAGDAGDGRNAPTRAVALATPAEDQSEDGSTAPVDDLVAVLRKHVQGYGVLDDLFADPAVTDVFANAPVAENPLQVTADGQRRRTNVRLTADGAAVLASRFRAASGRAFSRADPVLDAVAENVGAAEEVRVAAVTQPASEGVAFAFRAGGSDVWTLPDLVANDTLPPRAAALLSLAVERAAAGLVTGARGAGKTTMLGALLHELPADVRLVALEDTRELPLAALQADGRDVQGLQTGSATHELSAADALRTALRLGEGALVVGEVRGEEAQVLYEAMRVGANASAVLGTIHGEDGASVKERVTTDLGVAASAFDATDLVVTVAAEGADRHVARIEEVVDGGFEPLFERGATLEPTGRLAQGSSELLAGLARPDERYADVLAALDDRTTAFERAQEGTAERVDSAAVGRADRAAVERDDLEAAGRADQGPVERAGDERPAGRTDGWPADATNPGGD